MRNLSCSISSGKSQRAFEWTSDLEEVVVVMDGMGSVGLASFALSHHFPTTSPVPEPPLCFSQEQQHCCLTCG